MKEINISHSLILALISFLGCNSSEYVAEDSENRNAEIIVEVEDYITYDGDINLVVTSGKDSVISTKSAGWLAYDIELKKTGLYQVSVITTNKSLEERVVWIEDQYNNKDNRIYNITGEVEILPGQAFLAPYISPKVSLYEGTHKMKFHFTEDLQIDKFVFKLIDNIESIPLSISPNRRHNTDPTNLYKQKDQTEYHVITWLWGSWGNIQLSFYNVYYRDRSATSFNLASEGLVSFKTTKVC